MWMGSSFMFIYMDGYPFEANGVVFIWWDSVDWISLKEWWFYSIWVGLPCACCVWKRCWVRSIGSAYRKAPTRCSTDCLNQFTLLIWAKWRLETVDPSLGTPIWLFEREGFGRAARTGSDWSCWWFSEYGAVNMYQNATMSLPCPCSQASSVPLFLLDRFNI